MRQSPKVIKSNLSQLYNGGEEGLAQLLDPNHLVHAVQVGDDVQSNLQQSVQVKSCKKIQQKQTTVWKVIKEYRVKKAIKTNTVLSKT